MEKQIYSETNEAFVEWLKQQRKDKGLSLRQVGEKINRHHSIIGNVERKVRRMDVAEFYEYCLELNLDPHDCIAYLEQAKKKKFKK